MYSKEQPYTKERAKVIFQLLESGCTITEEKNFNLLLMYK